MSTSGSRICAPPQPLGVGRSTDTGRSRFTRESTIAAESTHTQQQLRRVGERRVSGSPNPFDFSDFQSQGSQFSDTGGPQGAFGGGSFGGGPSPLDQSPSFDPFAGKQPEVDSFGPPGPFGGTSARAEIGSEQGLFTADEVAGPPVLWCGVAAAAALIGASVMMTADWLGRQVMFPYEVPAGMMATLIGGAYFMMMMRKL